MIIWNQLPILYIFAQIFKYFTLFCPFLTFFCPFLPFFWKIAQMPLLSRIDPANHKSRTLLPIFTNKSSFYPESRGKSYIPSILIYLQNIPSISRGWSRALLWVLVELCQIEGQPKVSPWLATRGNIFKIVDSWGQLIPTFLSKHWWKHKQIRVLW